LYRVVTLAIFLSGLMPSTETHSNSEKLPDVASKPFQAPVDSPSFTHSFIVAPEGWTFVVRDTSCSLLQAGATYLDVSQSIHYLIKLSYTSKDYAISDIPKLVVDKNQEYTLSIKTHLEIETSRLEMRQVPMDILIQDSKLEQRYDEDNGWISVNQGEFVKQLLLTNTKRDSFDFKIRIAGQGDYQLVTLPNLDFPIKAHLLQQCEKYFE
jgi:hypothetical protein